MKFNHLGGLIPAPHTPLHPDGSLNVAQVPRQVEHYVASCVHGAFVGGTTGEGLSFSFDERVQLAQAWLDAARGTNLSIIIQVGGNCLSECERMAQRAAELGAAGIAALAPCFFRPQNVGQLLDYCRRIANSAPQTPFFFYDIPGMTQVRLPMADLLRQALEIPNFAGLKYSNDDLTQLQECLAVAPERYRVLFGFDQFLFAGLVLGVHGAVGSTYNFAAHLYLDMMSAVKRGDLETARTLQLQSVRLIRCLERHGFMAASKAAMQLVGVPCGPVRSPLTPLNAAAEAALLSELRDLAILKLR